MNITKQQKEYALKNQTVKHILNADIVYDTATKTREEIFGAESIRNKPDKLTGSQLGIALGLSNFSSPLSLWKKKRGLEEVMIDGESEVLLAGHAAEDFVAKMFARKLKEDYGDTLISVDIVCDTNMYQSRTYPWAIGEPDRFAILSFTNGNIELVGLECKTVNNKPAIDGWKNLSFPCPSFYEESGETTIPPTYDAQNRHYLMTTGLDAWYTCACWGFRIDQAAIALIVRDSIKEKELVEAAETFITCCVEGYEPEICKENAVQIAELLNEKYDLNQADRIEADESYLPLINEATSLANEKAKLKKALVDIEAKEIDLAKRLVEKTDGKGSYISFKSGESTIGISLGISHFKDSINIDAIKEECPEIYEKMAEIGRKKVSKTDLEKLEINGKKFDASPYIVEGVVNTSKPITISKVTVKQMLTA